MASPKSLILMSLVISLSQEMPVLSSFEPLTREEGIRVITQAEAVIFNGLNLVKENIEQLPEESPGEEAWQKLNRTMEEYFKEQYQSIQNDTSKKQILENVNEAFLNQTEDFIQIIQTNYKNKQAPKPPSFPQNIIALFTGGTQQIATNVSNLESSSGNSSTSKPNFFSNILANLNGGSNQKSNATTTTTTSAENPPAGGFFGQIVNNFRPTSSAVPGATNNEATTPSGGGFLQNIGNLFKQSTTTLAPTSEAQGLLQNVIQNVNPFKSSTEIPLTEGGTAGNVVGGFMRNTEMLMCVNMGKFLNKS